MSAALIAPKATSFNIVGQSITSALWRCFHLSPEDAAILHIRLVRENGGQLVVIDQIILTALHGSETAGANLRFKLSLRNHVQKLLARLRHLNVARVGKFETRRRRAA